MNARIYNKSLFPSFKRDNFSYATINKNISQNNTNAISISGEIKYESNPKRLEQPKKDTVAKNSNNIKLKIRQQRIVGLKKKKLKPFPIFNPFYSQFNKTQQTSNSLFRSIDSTNQTQNKNKDPLIMNNCLEKKASQLITDEVESLEHKNINTEITLPHIRSNTTYYPSQLNKTKHFIWSKCDEIEYDCSSFEKGVNKRPSKVMKTKITSIQKEYGVIKGVIEELNPRKRRKKDAKELLKLKVKNKRVLRETHCVEKLSNELAFEANSVLENMFLFKKRTITEKEPKTNTKLMSQNKINEMKELSEKSRAAVRRINKLCIKYDISSSNN